MEILFGLHPVEEALRSGTRKFDHICIARERQDQRLEKLIQACRDAGVKLRLDTRDQLTKLARTEAHQGVVAIVRARQFLELDDLLQGPRETGCCWHWMGWKTRKIWVRCCVPLKGRE